MMVVAACENLAFDFTALQILDCVVSGLAAAECCSSSTMEHFELTLVLPLPQISLRPLEVWALSEDQLVRLAWGS